MKSAFLTLCVLLTVGLLTAGWVWHSAAQGVRLDPEAAGLQVAGNAEPRDGDADYTRGHRGAPRPLTGFAAVTLFVLAAPLAMALFLAYPREFRDTDEVVRQFFDAMARGPNPGLDTAGMAVADASSMEQQYSLLNQRMSDLERAIARAPEE